METSNKLTGGEKCFLGNFQKLRIAKWPKPRSLQKWMCGPVFRKEYRAICRGMEVEMKIQLLMAILQAWRSLGSLKAGSAEHRGAMALIRLGRGAVERCAKRSGAKTASADEPRTFEQAAERVIHPDAPREEAMAFIREML